MKIMELVATSDEWGQTIDHARVESGIHINDLCKNIGMSATTYTKFEKKTKYSSITSSAS